MKRIAILICLAGCAIPKTAIIDGKEVPRQTFEFNGQPFTVKHEGAHPRPRGPSSGLRGDGGAIRGRVCGMNVDFDVAHRGNHVQLVGSIDNHIPVAIAVGDEGGVRHFTGNLGPLGVDFTLAGAQMQGHVGIRVFLLEPAGDDYQGFMRVPGLLDINGGKQRTGVIVRGRDALWSMPSADQAAVLPALMTCSGMQFNIGNGLDVGIGGEATDRPPETSAVYTHGI